MGGLLKKENYTLHHNLLFWMTLICLVLVALLGAKGYRFDLTKRRDAIGIFDSMVYDSVIWIILLSAVFSVILGSEFANKTIDHEIFAGYSRTFVYFSKFLLYDTTFCLLLLIYPLTGFLRMLGPLGLSDNLSMTLGLDLIGLTAVFIQYSVMFSQVLLVVVLSGDLLRSTAVNGMLALTCGLAAAYGEPSGWYNKFRLLKLLPMQQVRDIVSKGNPTSFGMSLLSGLGMITVMNGLAFLIFRKKNLK